MVDAPERIWIESDGECPYFYHEEELSDVSPPITEYVRADILRERIQQSEARAEQLAEALREAQPFIGWTGSYPELHAKIDALLREQEADRG